MPPIVSIIMPSYRSAPYVGDAIASVVRQTFADWELIVADNPSDDCSSDVIAGWAAREPRIRHVRLAENLGGAAQTRNRAISQATGRYLAFLDADDLWREDKLERQIDLMRSKKYSLVYTGYRVIDECGEVIWRHERVPREMRFRDLLMRTAIATSTVVIDRHRAGNVEFPSNVPLSEDYPVWLGVLKRAGPAGGLDYALADYRVVRGSRSSQKIRSAAVVWHVYRTEGGLGLLASLVCFANYVAYAVAKNWRFGRFGWWHGDLSGDHAPRLPVAVEQGPSVKGDHPQERGEESECPVGEETADSPYQSPLVSIVMPVRNGGRFIADALDSIRCQTFRDWELIVVDDASDDDTAMICEGYVARDSRMEYVHSAERIGVAMARNTALKRAKGRFVAFLDADDTWKPEKLARQIPFHQTAGVAITYSAYGVVDQQGRNKGAVPVSRERVSYGDLLAGFRLGCLTVVVDRSVTGFFSCPIYIRASDLATWLAILVSGGIAYGLREELATYRIVPGSVSYNKIRYFLRIWPIYRDQPIGTPLRIRSYIAAALRGTARHIRMRRAF